MTGYTYCLECGTWRESDTPRCPNPACHPGLLAYTYAMRAWRAECDEYVTRRQATAGTAYNVPALRDAYERENPAPRLNPAAIQPAFSFA